MNYFTTIILSQLVKMMKMAVVFLTHYFFAVINYTSFFVIINYTAFFVMLLFAYLLQYAVYYFFNYYRGNNCFVSSVYQFFYFFFILFMSALREKLLDKSRRINQKKIV